MTIFHTHLRCSSWWIYLPQNKSVKIRWQSKKLIAISESCRLYFSGDQARDTCIAKPVFGPDPAPAINSRKKRSLFYRFDSCCMRVVTVSHKSSIFQFCVHTLIFMNYGMCRAEMSLLWHKSGPLWPELPNGVALIRCLSAALASCTSQWRFATSHPSPGGILPYMGYIGMCRCEGYGFQAVYSGIGYINQSVWI